MIQNMSSRGIGDSKFNNNGFTLIEILVALALFSLVISITVGIFVVGSGSQRKTIELYTVQREASYIMETVSGNWIRYCLADINDNCGNGIGFEYFSRDGNRISSSEVKIEDLRFYVSEDFNLTQPLITIILKVKSRGKYGTSVILQDSISLRIYN
jgi:prepilin-type N-terminal cleavage/methylation domain-containing protein